MTISHRIIKIRKSKNLTQAEVAYRINITPSAYGQIERNASRTQFNTLCKIAEALEVPITLLVDLSNAV
jgi:transcriptional regulator with XRE-family HTH domain